MASYMLPYVKDVQEFNGPIITPQTPERQLVVFMESWNLTQVGIKESWIENEHKLKEDFYSDGLYLLLIFISREIHESLEYIGSVVFDDDDIFKICKCSYLDTYLKLRLFDDNSFVQGWPSDFSDERDLTGGGGGKIPRKVMGGSSDGTWAYFDAIIRKRVYDNQH